MVTLKFKDPEFRDTSGSTVTLRYFDAKTGQEDLRKIIKHSYDKKSGVIKFNKAALTGSYIVEIKICDRRYGGINNEVYFQLRLTVPPLYKNTAPMFLSEAKDVHIPEGSKKKVTVDFPPFKDPDMYETHVFSMSC